MADYKMLAEMGVPMPSPENLIMDEDLKLADRLARHAVGAVNELEDDLFAAHEAITRLHATITQMTNTIDGLEFQLNEARAEIEALKSDVSDLVRAGSDEATENERLRKALRPFAALGATYLTERQRIHVPDDVPTQPTVFLVGEVRAASRTLEGE